jgi:plasmid stabilization system protein ParE
MRCAAWIVALAACSSSKSGAPVASTGGLSPKALADLAHVVTALERSNPDDVAAKLVRGLGEVAIDDLACARLFVRYPLTNPAERQRLVQDMFTACHFTCPAPALLGQTATLGRAPAIAAIAADCNARHADPLHGVGLTEVRDYLVLRNGLEAVLDRLAATGTDEATQLGQRLRTTIVPLLARPEPTATPVDAGVAAPPPDAEVASVAPRGRVSVGTKAALDDTTLTSDLVLQKLTTAYLSAIHRCWRTQLAADPQAHGKLALAFGVDARGKIDQPTATGMAPVDACVSAAMAGWTFPIPRAPNGDATTARFTFTLQLTP